MECDICHRKDVAQVGMHCTVCARTTIYGLRIESARSLLEKESLARKVEQITSTPLPKDASDELRALSRTWRSEARKSNLQAAKQRVETLQSGKADSQAEVLQLRKEIDEKRAGLALRRKDLEITEGQVPSRRQSLVDKLNQIGNRGIKSFNNMNNSTIETRAFLCREAANLLGLRYQKLNNEEGRTNGRSLIGGHVIPDLRYIHSMLP